MVLFSLANVGLAEDDIHSSFGVLPTANNSVTNAAPNYVIAPVSVPTIRILPEDVVQDSILQVRFTPSTFAVKWTYTEAGAKKMLAFREAQEGQKVRTLVGDYVTPPTLITFQPMPPLFTNYTQWKKGWLKRRTDKYFGVREEDARAISTGLKGK